MHYRPIFVVLLAAAVTTPACLNLPIPRAVSGVGVAGSPKASVVSPRVNGESPFAGAYFMVDPDSNAGRQYAEWKDSRKADAALLKKIADQSTAAWFGDWTPMIEQAMSKYVEAHVRIDALPVFVLYNVPNRDCGQYSKGGAISGDRYKRWIAGVRKGIGTRRAVAVLEPDALGLLDKCLSKEDQEARLELLRYAVHELESTPGTAVYIDAGHDAWQPAPEMARRLKLAGIDEASGFALNTSNYRATESLIAYGTAISALVGGKHFIIDTGRNGNGPFPASTDSEASWCNPPGRALGVRPTTNTGNPLVDAFLWVKPPGESDGTCNKGPRAGVFWPDYALGLAKRAKW
jgi:endoglucanase